MGEVMKTWLRTRLGVIMDLRPEIFGHYTRDGTLLAKILHSYDIITRSQLETIITTQDPALSRVNLRLLRVWLRFLGITLPDESLDEISRGKGTTALRLFYKLYLCLESKDSLHFITLQKEREKYLPTSTKFDVTTVSEEPPPYEPPSHPLSKKLCEQKETVVEWHRPKLLSILRRCKEEGEKLEAAATTDRTLAKGDPVAEKNTPSDAKVRESESADEFARKHRARALKQEDYTVDRTDCELPTDFSLEDPKKAKSYVDDMKKRRKRTAAVEAINSRLQKSLLSDILERSSEKEEQRFDEAIAKRLLDQSRYEKQIMTKLCEVREQKRIIVENQKIVEDLVQKAKEQEHSLQSERDKEKLLKEAVHVETEYQRLCELHYRIKEDKLKKLREKHYQFCRGVLWNIINISIKATEYRQVIGDVPDSLWYQWKALFLRGQSPLEEIDVDESLEKYAEDEEEAFQMKLEGKGNVQDRTFKEYLSLDAPWDQFAPKPSEDEENILKLGIRVLGYIVHRLLQQLHASSLDRSVHNMRKPRTVALILGIPNPTLYETIEQLLGECGVRLIRMENAINHCLAKYRSEMADFEYIDLSIVRATDSALMKVLHKSDSKKQVSSRKKVQGDRSQKTEVKADAKAAKQTKASGKTLEEKETQTPREIPFDDMDPVLSNAAYIGKWTYEFLTLGEPISNELLVQAFVEYLRSLTDTEGWAIVDYPNTYEQMALMESLLTGRQLAPDTTPLDFKNINIEAIDPLPPRVRFHMKQTASPDRLSTLVPNPISRNESQGECASFATIYIKVMPKPKNLRVDVGQIYEVSSANATPIDLFYIDQKKAYAFYYSLFDVPTLSRLAKLVISGPSGSSISSELFPDALGKLERTFQRASGDSKLPVIVHLVSSASEADVPEIGAITDQPTESDQSETGLRKPGELNWQWLDLPLPSALIETLATLWEKMEQSYIESVKEMLLLKSIHATNVLPYTDFVRRNMKKLIEKSDERQELLAEFQHAFNSIDEDARDDVDVKCELHRRVADFQARLWDMSDKKREEAESERRRIIGNQWVPLEMITLANIYTGLVQAELDRSIDTLHLIQDYYAAMLQRPLQESHFSKTNLNSTLDVLLENREESGEKLSTQKTTKASTRAKSTLQGNLDKQELEHFVRHQLINQLEEPPSIAENPAYKAVLENVKLAQTSIDSIYSTISEMTKKEGALLLKSPGKESARKKASDGRGDSGSNRGEDLFLEWQYAIDYELCRIRFQLQVLTGAAQADISFLLSCLSKTFHAIYDSIVERYKREIKSVNDMANVFCFAIEEGRAIEEKMMLVEDRFVVKGKDSVIPSALEERRDGVLSKESRVSLSQMIELYRLMGIFRRVAPQGTLSERSFIYILQDIVQHGEESGVLLFPCSWYQLAPSDIVILARRLFGNYELILWREFVLYLMNLTMPSKREILMAREQFRKYDPNLTETITRKQFHLVPLWFTDSSKMTDDVQEILRRKFSRNANDFLVEELDSLQRKRSNLMYGEYENSNEWSSHELEAEILRKEILCQMFLTNKEAVNYTGLLLAFCKDTDPREGFGKALTLAIGNIVCTEAESGDAYIDQDFLNKDFEGEGFSRDSLLSEATEVAKTLLECLISETLGQVKVNEAQGSQGDQPLSRGKLPVQRSASGGGDVSKIPSINRDASSTGSSEEQFDDALANQLDIEIEIDERMCHWIPRDTCLAVLAAILPSYADESALFENTMSLKEAVKTIYDELWEERLSSERNTALSHRLLNHKLISKLLENITNFTEKRLPDLIEELLRNRDQPAIGR